MCDFNIFDKIRLVKRDTMFESESLNVHTEEWETLITLVGLYFLSYHAAIDLSETP